MGNFYEKPIKTGPSPYTRSGEPPPKLEPPKMKNAPIHRVHDPMSLELHMADDRVRTAGLSTAEREWRKKFVKDQLLHPDEPIHVDAIHRQINPLRIVTRWPWDKLYEHFLRPSFGVYNGTLIRTLIPKTIWIYFYCCFAYYLYKYEIKNWQRLLGLQTFPKAKFYDLYKDGHSEEDIRLGIASPEHYNYYDRDYVHRMQTFEIGQTKRPW